MPSSQPELPQDTAFGTLPMPMAARAGWWLATLRAIPRTWRKPIRKRVAKRYAGPYDLSCQGIRFRAYPSENHCDRTIAGRNLLPEQPERTLIAPLLKPDMVFVDIGANVGVYSLFVSSMTNGTARVLALEPNPRSFAKLVENCAINSFANIIPVNAAAGPQVGVAQLAMSGSSNAGAASLRVQAAPGQSVNVQVRPLADMISEAGIGKPDLMKIDVEGFEDQALAPFFQTAPQLLWPRHLLLEIVHASLWHEDVFALLDKCGYEIMAKTDENTLYRLK